MADNNETIKQTGYNYIHECGAYGHINSILSTDHPVSGFNGEGVRQDLCALCGGTIEENHKITDQTVFDKKVGEIKEGVNLKIRAMNAASQK